MRKIRLAKTAGFCFGVNRAVEMVEMLLDQGKRVCTLGEIIHNSQLVESLAQRGARTVASVDEVKEGEILVIRSHGVERSVYEAAAEKGIAEAQSNLGECLYKGEGCEKNLEEAVKWLRASADQDHGKAQYYLALCLIHGEGCPKDSAEGLIWLRRAAEGGYHEARRLLGRLEEEDA